MFDKTSFQYLQFLTETGYSIADSQCYTLRNSKGIDEFKGNQNYPMNHFSFHFKMDKMPDVVLIIYTMYNSCHVTCYPLVSFGKSEHKLYGFMVKGNKSKSYESFDQFKDIINSSKKA